MNKRITVLMFCAMLICGIAKADVTVPTMFSDHTVLQRDISVPVWGTASALEVVTVKFTGQTKVAIADENGDWMVTLDRMDANSIPSEMVIEGNNKITIYDILVGEVWVGSGQSNMFNSLSKDCDADAAIEDLEEKNYNIRFFNVGSGTPDGTVWEVINSETSLSFSAVHFYFGRHLADLAENLQGVPIGLIHSAVSATAIERWATCAGNGGLYLDQIEPLQPYAIRGVTWYQGEWDTRNAKDAEKYYWQLPCLISEWRTDWGQGDFPFYVVQMPKMGLGSIHTVRDAELQAVLDDPKVEMIVTIDNPGSDVHPPCKKLFGDRLALLARKFVYGELNIDARSPFYNAVDSYVAGNRIGVVFDDVAGGLQSSGGPLAEWEIAGIDGSYVAANADIVGTNTVEVWSPDISNPVSARYAFSTNPEANNLVNLAGLPASPIREITPGSGDPVCGDGNCDPGEDQCNDSGGFICADCGVPPSTETNCGDGDDNDCDSLIDCDDTDCSNSTTCDNYCDEDGVCEPGEDCITCPGDCAGNKKGKPNGRYCCGNGVEESQEDNGSICDGNY